MKFGLALAGFAAGAVLGDRIRMQSRSVDPGTFIRSMATRGHLGGLARSTSDALLVLDAAGFECAEVAARRHPILGRITYYRATRPSS